MANFDALVKFTAKEDGAAYFAPIAGNGKAHPTAPSAGSSFDGYQSLSDLQAKQNSKKVTVNKLLAPLPTETLPIYCVGLNYRSHAKEASLTIPKYPPLWTKPAASLANPDEPIPVNKFCALSLLDFEGELVFVTSKECKDVSPEEASKYILGYTIGNDLSCRFFQLQNNSAGQFFYAKAFDKFAPIGPVLLSAERFNATDAGRKLVTRVNGKVAQNVEINADMIFPPARVLSHMSQGTTIPAYTAVMTGTAAGVGAFQKPKSFLNDGDVVEVEVDGIGKLQNVLRFEGLSWWHKTYLSIFSVVVKWVT